MTSASGQTQFRLAHPPSKVLHLRNLPWECKDEEIIELCSRFGKVVNTKCNVGANRNQAFVEFADVNQAISMVSYYASSSEPAQVRGKTVYLQYSNRQEVVNNKSSGDVPSNVLLVTIEGVEASDVSIDVLHLVFSAFGFVQKIATFEKGAGFQVLVQFVNIETASAAKAALDGRSIPRYLLPEHVVSCYLRIFYSAHTDLTVKFQSHRSRDYTNPYLPVCSTAIEGAGQIGPDGKRKEPESNVLLASIENMQYAVTIDVLHTVFSAYGFVQKIAIFEKNGGFHVLIQYPDVATAVAAKEALEGHCIYDGGFCKLHLAYSRHTDLNVKGLQGSDKSRDYTLPDPHSLPSVLGPQPATARPNSLPNVYPGVQANSTGSILPLAQTQGVAGMHPQVMRAPLYNSSYASPGPPISSSPQMGAQIPAYYQPTCPPGASPVGATIFSTGLGPHMGNMPQVASTFPNYVQPGIGPEVGSMWPEGGNAPQMPQTTPSFPGYSPHGAAMHMPNTPPPNGSAPYYM